MNTFFQDLHDFVQAHETHLVIIAAWFAREYKSWWPKIKTSTIASWNWYGDIHGWYGIVKYLHNGKPQQTESVKNK